MKLRKPCLPRLSVINWLIVLAMILFATWLVVFAFTFVIVGAFQAAIAMLAKLDLLYFWDWQFQMRGW